ncbi:GNAT family N-acetyltransferase [Alteraurantiacibacter aquimixticola]|uniref:N-acetyltransferase n=1 Tax=Alteraurantiacibacter aquimixticola TaxID=2489173 RepID=A0A4T3EX46_9SPHN|nr:GNAT family N-acetyltransferase [Alteraurantiacibacter aquimixticola]TIX49165.1 N-acetyltransferase [Alteraurantiacibacter aquimixticola]
MAEFRLETERLVLRDWREEDWDRFFEVTNTPAGMRWLGGVADEAARTLQRERFESYHAEHGHTFWALERKQDGGFLSGEMLGTCGLKKSNSENGPLGEFEIGWRLRQDAWGKGYAHEAARACMDLAVDHFGAPRVIALTVQGNEASWGLMKRLGMQRREDLDFNDPRFGPDLNPTIAYSITAEQWAGTRG